MKKLLLLALTGCNALLGNDNFTTIGDAGDPCVAAGQPTTSLTGVVFAPNGTLPLHGAAVYVPTEALAPIPAGVGKPVCASGAPVAFGRTNARGEFELSNVPSGDVRLVIQVGKWRREVMVPNVQACAANPVGAALTRLPRSGAEGDMPQIAISTGSADALECMLRDVGIAESEFVTGSDPGHVHMFVENGTGQLDATPLDPAATSLFSPASALDAFDVVMLGCPGNPSTVATTTTTAAAKAWTEKGGWLFLTHFQFQWLVLGPAPWSTLATFTTSPGATTPTVASVDRTSPIGMQQAEWLRTVGASTTLGEFPLTAGKNACTMADTTQVTRRMFLDPARNGGLMGVQNFTFDASNGGRVTFGDIHVSGVGGSATSSFPASCPATTPNANELALMFEMFETPTCDP